MAGSIDTIIQTVRGTVQFGSGFTFINSDSTEVNTSTIQGQIDAYNKCTVVQDVIELKASLHSTLKIAAINESGRWLGGNAGTDIEKRTIREDLKAIHYYNPEQTVLTFQHQLKTLLHIFGFVYIWKLKIVGTNKYNYYLLPVNRVHPQYGYKPKYDAWMNPIAEKYFVDVVGDQLELTPDEVFIIGDRMASFDHYSRNVSRLVALKEPISAILSANQMFTQLVADGGARGAIGLGAKDADMTMLLDEDKRLMQKELKDYGKLRGQLKYIVSKGALSYTPFTSTIVDMQLPENLLSKKVDIYRAYGAPTAFAVNEARFQVMPEARKEIFNACVTPEGKCIYDEILKIKDIPERNWVYVADDSHHDFKMKDLKDSSIAFQQASNAVIPLRENEIITQQQAEDYLDPYLR